MYFSSYEYNNLLLGRNIMTYNISSKKLTRTASIISLYTALLLVSIKSWAWLKTDSIALLTTVVDSSIDVLASIITFIGVYYAQQPADYEHRYGHGKAEAVAAFVQALLLVGAGFILAIESIDLIITPQVLSEQNFGIYIIIISILCSSLLVIMQTIVIKHTNSTAIVADRTHYLTDIILNTTVLFSLVIGQLFNYINIDAITALIISSYIIWNAYSMIKIALLQLLDRELSSIDRQRITITALNCPGVKGIHDLRTRDGGDRFFIELHAEVDGKLTVDTGHNICDKAEIMVKKLFIAAEVSVHLEPVGITDKRIDDQIN